MIVSNLRSRKIESEGGLLNLLKNRRQKNLFFVFLLTLGLFHAVSSNAQPQYSNNHLKSAPGLDNFNLVQEMEANYRENLLLVTKKALECISQAKNQSMLYICKSDENHDLKVIKNKKAEFEIQFLKNPIKSKSNLINSPAN